MLLINDNIYFTLSVSQYFDSADAVEIHCNNWRNAFDNSLSPCYTSVTFPVHRQPLI